MPICALGAHTYVYVHARVYEKSKPLVKPHIGRGRDREQITQIYGEVRLVLLFLGKHAVLASSSYHPNFTWLLFRMIVCHRNG